MKYLLLVLVLIAVAVSGCMEKSPSNKGLGVENIKLDAVKAAENLTTYSLDSSANQTLTLNSGINATEKNVTVILESARTSASVNLTDFKAKANGFTKSILKLSGKADNSSSTKAEVYQVGNSTYIMNDQGNWTHLLDPRSALDIWGNGSNNQVKSMADMINSSQLVDIGSEKIDGEDSYKFKVVTGSGDYENLFNTSFGIAAKLSQYPLLVPDINRSELNASSEIEKTIWISKESLLPLRYESSTRFKMTPIIIGGMNPATGEIKRFNQSLRLGEVSVDIETKDSFSGFNKPVVLSPPAQALNAVTLRTDMIQS